MSWCSTSRGGPTPARVTRTATPCDRNGLGDPAAGDRAHVALAPSVIRVRDRGRRLTRLPASRGGWQGGSRYAKTMLELPRGLVEATVVIRTGPTPPAAAIVPPASSRVSHLPTASPRPRP